MCFIKHHFDLISRPVSAMCTLHNEKPKSKHKCYCFNGRLQPDVKVSALGNNFRNTHNSNAKETEKFCFTLFTLTPIFCPLEKKKKIFFCLDIIGCYNTYFTLTDRNKDLLD